MSESQQAKALLDWLLFWHMQAELDQELCGPIQWKNGYGVEIEDVDWNKGVQA